MVIAVSIPSVLALLMNTNGDRLCSVLDPQATCFVRVVRALKTKVKACWGIMSSESVGLKSWGHMYILANFAVFGWVLGGTQYGTGAVVCQRVTAEAIQSP